MSQEVKMSNYKCSKCDFSSKTKGTTKTHCSNKCDGAEIIEEIVLIECEQCGKKCETENLMDKHKKNCIKKRVEIINNDVGGDLKKQNLIIMNMLSSFSKEIDALKNDNKELKKRIEKLEGGIKVQNDNKKKGFTEIDEEEVDCYSCSVQERVVEAFQDYEKLLKFLYGPTSKFAPVESFCTILDKSGNAVSAKATENCITVIIGDKSTKYKWGSIGIITKDENCGSDVKYQVLKTEKCYCESHFNKETGKPVE